MKFFWLIAQAALTLALASAGPLTAHAAVIYDQIIVQNALGTILASVTATPSEIAADPDATYFVSGIATDPNEHGNYGIVVDSDGNPFEVFGPADGGPDGNDLAFALQEMASGYFIQNPQPDSGAPIDLTFYLDPSLQAAGDTATFRSTGAGSAVPEPLTWAMMAVGFGAIGYRMRRRPAQADVAR